MPTRVGVGLVCVLCVAAPAAARAAARPQQAGGAPAAVSPDRGGGRADLPPRAARRAAPRAEGLTAAQAEQLFDRYVLAQARVALQLSPEQVVPFRQRLQQVQMARRRGQRERQQLLNQLNAISRGGNPVDDDAVEAQMNALDAATAASDKALRDARARLDDVLTVRQRARFRIFEQRMERQKVDLIARARQAARPAAAETSAAPAR
jgi:hypothetical protein